MKILQLRFKNLNSLYGEWSIDFTEPVYAANGIFAITGPTGSGKSTVLDAICLALYGMTPRLSKVVKSSNEIMSRKTAECFAEVVFESQRGRFKCHWSQVRARKSPSGNLQEPAHEISDADSGTLIESKRSLVAGVIEKMTGMSFLQFTRSILLAQGSFAAFLQTSSKERAPILEQITGGDMYSLISTRIFERQREENSRLESLNAEIRGIRIMLPEEEAAVRSELAGQQQAETEIRLLYEADSRALQWLAGIETLQSEIIVLKGEAVKNEELLAVFRPQRDKLELAMRAAELEAEYAALTITRQNQGQEKEALHSVESLLPALENACIACDKQHLEAEKILTDHKRAHSEQKPLWQRVRALDVKLKEQSTILDSVSAECRQLEAQICENEQRQKEFLRQQQKATDELEKISGVLKANSADEALVSQFSAISELIDSLQAVAETVAKRQRDLDQEKKTADRAGKDQKARENEFNTLRTIHTDAEKALSQKTEEMQQLLGGKLLREYQTERDTLLREAGFIKRIAGFAAERRFLEDGRPCPLCGSTEHPFALGNIPELDENSKRTEALDRLIGNAEAIEIQIRALQIDEHDLAKKMLVAESAAAQAGQALENAGKAVLDKAVLVGEAETQMREARDGILKKLGGLGIAEIPGNDMAALLASLRKRLHAWQENQGLKTNIESRIQSLVADLKGLEGVAVALAEALDSRKNALLAMQQTMMQLQTERKMLFGERSPDEEEQQSDKQIALAEKALQKALTAADQARMQRNDAITRKNGLNESISRRSGELAGLEKSFALNLERKGFSGEDAFLAGRLLEEHRQRLVEQARVLDSSVSENATRLRDRERRLAAERQQNLSSRSAAELHEIVTGQTETIRRLGEAIGGLKQKLEDNRRAVLAVSSRKAELERQSRECSRWNLLNSLIGSGDGQKYSRFAQGLTFGIIVSLANQQLEKMTGRYLLTRDSEDLLELKVIDKYQAGEIRSTKNLSGGESFIVSLALALGLSKLASKKVRVDSLFLDEGFGTLDDDALQLALDTLAGLQQDGKLIGVISHVPMLKERIGTQITVTGSNIGRSTLAGPGVSRL